MRLSELRRTFDFVKAAELTRPDNVYAINFSREIGHTLAKDVVYLITRDDDIFYIGQTRRGLKKRVASYADNFRKDNKMRFVHHELLKAFSKHGPLEVWAYSPPTIQIAPGFTMQPLADFERMLVEMVNPIWNRDLMKRKKTDKGSIEASL